MISDKEKLLALLRERGPEGIHTSELRRRGVSGNPSARREDLIADGYSIRSERESYRGRDGKTRPGARFTLDAGLASDTGTATPEGPGSLGGSVAGEPGDRGLFELPTYMDPDFYEEAA